MSVTNVERKEIRNIIVGDFEIAESELRIRRDTIENKLRSEVKDTYEAKQKELRKLVKRQQAKVQKFEAEMRDWYNELLELGFEIDSKYDKTPGVSVSWEDSWQPKGLETDLDKVETEVHVDFSQANQTLRILKNNAFRQVSLSALESDDADKLLKQVMPNVEQLLPARPLRELLKGEK